MHVETGNLRCYTGGVSIPVHNKKRNETVSIDINGFELTRFEYSAGQISIDGKVTRKIIGSKQFLMSQSGNFIGEILLPEVHFGITSGTSGLNQGVVYVNKTKNVLWASFETFGLNIFPDTQIIKKGFRIYRYDDYVSKTIPGLSFLDLDSKTVTEDEKIKQEAIELLAEKVQLEAKRVRLDSKTYRLDLAYTERDPEGYLEKLHADTKARMMAA